MTAIYLQFPEYYCPVLLRGYGWMAGRTGTSSVPGGTIWREDSALLKRRCSRTMEQEAGRKMKGWTQTQTINKSMLLTKSKESRSSFSKGHWLINKSDYKWFYPLQVKHQSLADFWLNGLFFSPSNVLALRMTCGKNPWHKLSSKLWPRFPGRKKRHRLKLPQEACQQSEWALHTVGQAHGTALLLCTSTNVIRGDCTEFVASKNAHESCRMKAHVKDRSTLHRHGR